MATTYYQPSGKVPVTLVPAALLGLLAMLPLAWAYVWLTTRAPVLLNVFIAFAYATCLGLTTMFVGLRAKVRNPDWMSRVGVGLALAGWYCQWAVWIAAMVANGRDQAAVGASFAQFLVVAADPAAMLRFAIALADSGAMQIANWRPPAFMLALVWFGELATHLMVAPLMGRMRGEHPFCEVARDWAARVVVPRRFALIGVEDLKALEAEPLRVLALPLARQDAADYAQVELYRCMQSDAFLSITNVRTGPIDGGRPESRKSLVLEYLRLPGLDPDALLERWSQPLAQTPGDAERPIPPELAPALAAFQGGAHAAALAAASNHTDSERPAVRTDALRLCALACSRLERWEEAGGYWRALFAHEASAHNALQAATSAVMAGALAAGVEWVEHALALNAESAELPALQILTNFVTALAGAGQERAAMPYLERIRQVYADLGTTDPTFLHLRRVPFFSAFLENSGPLVRAALDRERGRQWYADLLPSLDANGKQELSAWLDSEFGEGARP